jgi:hypothetical protein
VNNIRLVPAKLHLHLLSEATEGTDRSNFSGNSTRYGNAASRSKQRRNRTWRSRIGRGIDRSVLIENRARKRWKSRSGRSWKDAEESRGGILNCQSSHIAEPALVFNLDLRGSQACEFPQYLHIELFRLYVEQRSRHIVEEDLDTANLVAQMAGSVRLTTKFLCHAFSRSDHRPQDHEANANDIPAGWFSRHLLNDSQAVVYRNVLSSAVEFLPAMESERFFALAEARKIDAAVFATQTDRAE